MTLGDFVFVCFPHRPDGGAARTDRVDRRADQRGVRRSRSHPRGPGARDRGRGRRAPRAARPARGRGRVRSRELRVRSRRAGAEGVAFAPPAGTTTALVGSSGSGKSTLIGLVMALQPAARGPRARRRPRPGDGAAARLPRSARGRAAGELPLRRHDRRQHPLRPQPRDARRGARGGRIAHADEFVEALESKYDTVVGERGVKLSGGQRQRIAIARAILADPAHPRSSTRRRRASTARARRSSRTACDRLRSGRTTFVIAHRLSTIRSADQILVLEHGEIVERGTHARAAGRRRTLPGRSTTSSTTSRPTASSTPARTSRPSRRRRFRRRSRATTTPKPTAKPCSAAPLPPQRSSRPSAIRFSVARSV